MNQTQQIENPTLLIQKVHRWRMAFFGLVILLAGIVIGVAATFLMTDYVPAQPPPAPEFAAERMIERLRNQLRLSPDQVGRIVPIIQRRMQILQDIRASARPKIAEQLRLMNEEISTILREDQRRLWQKHLQRLQIELDRGPIRNGPGLERRFRGGREPDLPPLPVGPGPQPRPPDEH